MGNDKRVSARYAHWAVVSVLALAVMLWMAAMSGAVPDATSVQEQRIELAIRDSVFVRTKTMPVLAGVPTLLVIRNEDPVQHGFVSPMFAALYIRVEGEGIEVFGKGIEGVHLDPGRSQRIPDLGARIGASRHVPTPGYSLPYQIDRPRA